LLLQKKVIILNSTKLGLRQIDKDGKLDNESIKNYVDFYLKDFELLDNIYHRNNIYIYKSI